MVGGQAVNLWASHYLGAFPALKDYAPFTSKDIDFFKNPEAAEHLADAIDGDLYLPDYDDATPNAALVIGFLKKCRIEVDFMRAIVGVDDNSIRNRAITLAGPSPIDGAPVLIRVMHPLDCVRSRLANINVLKRTDDLAVRQATVSILVLGHFIAELLGRKSRMAIKEAQDTLQDLEYVIRNDHKGRISHLDDDIALKPETVLRQFLDHDGLDVRWRENLLAKALARTEKTLAQVYRQHSASYRLAKAARRAERDQRRASAGPQSENSN